MSHGHNVNVPAVHDLAGTFAGQQPTMQGLGNPLQQGAGAVNTGNPELDSETRAVMTQLAGLFASVAGEFGRISTDLTDVATEFQAFDQQVAEDENQVTHG